MAQVGVVSGKIGLGVASVLNKAFTSVSSLEAPEIPSISIEVRVIPKTPCIYSCVRMGELLAACLPPCLAQYLHLPPHIPGLPTPDHAL